MAFALSFFVPRLSFFRFFVVASLVFICSVCVVIFVPCLSFFMFFVMALVFHLWRLLSFLFLVSPSLGSL